MENIKSFLETSTIHGLTYISSGRKAAKLFWTIIVLSSFTAAGILIKEAFQVWIESPVKTTIESLPIAEINLPKVTVCPPKNVLTNLNYDLMMTKNLTINDDTRSYLIGKVMELIDNQHFDEVMKNFSLLYEENKYYNWYHEFSNMQLPVNNKNDLHLEFRMDTSATSGSVFTKDFGQKIHVENVTGNVSTWISFYVPMINESDDSQLHFEIERNKDVKIMDTLSLANEQLQIFDGKHIIINATQLSKATSFDFEYKRFMETGDIGDNFFGTIPGFKIKWYYTGKSVNSKRLIKIPHFSFFCNMYNLCVNALNQEYRR